MPETRYEIEFSKESLITLFTKGKIILGSKEEGDPILEVILDPNLIPHQFA